MSRRIGPRLGLFQSVAWSTGCTSSASTLRSWADYFGISQYYLQGSGIGDWIRRRIRMCYWKQWRYVRSKVRHLLALGTYKRQAILTAISSKSHWRLSRTQETHSEMTNDGLKQQGLISFRDPRLRGGRLFG